MIKRKELSEYTLDEIVTARTGEALMELGSGDSLKSITSRSVHLALAWIREVDKKREAENGKPKTKRNTRK